MRFPCGMHFSEGYICRKRQKRLLQRTRITAARNNSTKHCISLRWHYPNQVMGQSNTAYSQPASASTPFLRFLLYYSSDNLQSFFLASFSNFFFSLKALKKPESMAEHSSSRTPVLILTWWLKFSTCSRFKTDPAPVFRI